MDEEGNPYLTSHPELNSITAAAVYFNLTADELFHLFVPGYQDPLLGKPLGDNTTPSELALNIHHFVALLKDEKDDGHFIPLFKTKTTKIKKFKPLKAA